ncbi:MAG: hypothetical protein WBX38_21590 [Candidatus Sulfotelmatobacter sp.]
MSQSMGSSPSDPQKAILLRVTEPHHSCGALESRDAESWYHAEAEILRESNLRPLRRAVIVNIRGVVYTGEYDCNAAEGYTPGEWNPGDPVPVRVAGDKLYLRRRNGRELQTAIVKRIG